MTLALTQSPNIPMINGATLQHTKYHPDRERGHYTLDKEFFSQPALASFEKFLRLAPGAHTIDIKVRYEGQDYWFQADFLKHIKEVKP